MEAGYALVLLLVAVTGAISAAFCRTRAAHHIADLIGLGDPPEWAKADPHGGTREGRLYAGHNVRKGA